MNRRADRVVSDVTIKGVVIAWSARAEHNGWGKGRLRIGEVNAPDQRVDRGDRDVDIVGTIVGEVVGHTVELTGRYDTHPRFGRQFKIAGAVVCPPETADGFVEWLVQHVTGVGPARGRAICEHLGVGPKLWHAIESEPAALNAVPGITPEIAQRVRAAAVEARATRDAVVMLRGWGMTATQITRCQKAWHCDANEAAARIKANPYSLIDDVAWFGWKRADELARRVGIARDSELRILAALAESLNVASGDEGHCYMREGALVDAARGLLEGAVSAERIAELVGQAVERHVIAQRGTRFFPMTLARAELGGASDTSGRFMTATANHDSEGDL